MPLLGVHRSLWSCLKWVAPAFFHRFLVIQVCCNGGRETSQCLPCLTIPHCQNRFCPQIRWDGKTQERAFFVNLPYHPNILMIFTTKFRISMVHLNIPFIHSIVSSYKSLLEKLSKTTEPVKLSLAGWIHSLLISVHTDPESTAQSSPLGRPVYSSLRDFLLSLVSAEESRTPSREIQSVQIALLGTQ